VKRVLGKLLLVFGLLLGGVTCLAAQTLAADHFLELVSANLTGNEMERDQYLATSKALEVAPAAEVARVLPSVLQHTSRANEIHVRAYAAGLLISIAQRGDAAGLLSPSSEEISSLLNDADPLIQRAAVTITTHIIRKPGTKDQTYLTALIAAIRNPLTPQYIGVAMSTPLIGGLGSDDPKAVISVLSFLNRNDLTVLTRIAIMRHLTIAIANLPDEVDQLLTKGMDDPDARVRAAAVAAFAHSYRRNHHLAKDRVERMVNDPQEHPQVRQLAKDALAGASILYSDIDVTLGKPKAP
jgi:hypothetical protein